MGIPSAPLKATTLGKLATMIALASVALHAAGCGPGMRSKIRDAITVIINNFAPVQVAYPSNPAAYTLGLPISNNVPVITGGTASNFAVAPPLPTGLAIDPTTGVISGLPTALAASSVYVVSFDYLATIGGMTGTSSSNLTLSVVDLPPSSLTYSTNPAVYTVGSAITANTPSNAGGIAVSYSVFPALPAGLSIHPSTGLITGTPSAATGIATYTVTASNSGGSTNVGVSITVNDIAPTALAYSTNPATYVLGTPITANTPSNLGGIIVGYSVVPALPAGLTLNPLTGVISGTPSAITATAGYVVTGINTGGSANVTVTLTVNDAAPTGLTYLNNPVTYTVGSAITNNTPSNSGGTITSYSVVPALPAGLSLHPTTGVISGTPSAVAATATYTITGSNVTGSTNVGVDITVNDVAPTGLTYSDNPAVYTAGTPIPSNNPSNGGGVITSYSVVPALPAGLSLHPTTGVISGTPSVVVAAATYTVTGSNSGGSTNIGVLITVNNAPPTGLTYSVNPAVYTVGAAITANNPSNSGGVITSYSVVPALPAGLSLDPSTGVISGTPSAIAALATYTVTGSNSGGSTNVGVDITVNDAAPTGLAYSTNPATYVKGSAITNNTPSNSGGTITSYSVVPALPAGLSLHPTTGVISGTPSAVAATATYTITGSNVTGSTSVGVDITVNDVAPTGLTYSDNPAVYTAGTPIPNNNPSNGGGVITSYSVLPALPAGLSLDPSTGVISGTPGAIVTAATYTVTGTNSGGSTNVGVLITVNNVPPTGLTYSTNPATYVKGSAITANNPSNSGGVITSYSVVPALPAGLSLDPSTGVISGTPTGTSASATYTVTGSNSGGSTNVGVDITVNDAAPTGLAYSTNPATYVNGTAIANNTPSNSGGVITSYSVVPALPAGLSLHPTTGVISGTPSAVAATATYTITGSNVTGSTNVGVDITVNDAAPTGLAYSTNPAIYVNGTAIANNTPSNSGGVITSYSVVPALPAGLSLHPTTGVISGTPTGTVATATYTVTGTNITGSTNVGVQITVNDAAPSGLAYSDNPIIYIKDAVITANVPSNSGGVITSYSVVPSLPLGLSLDPVLGLITGTPTALTAMATYTVTGTNVTGSTNVGVLITVNDAAPTGLAYSANPVIYTKGTPITSNVPSNAGGAITSYSVVPALPAGLSLHPTTGVISGTPTAVAAAATYMVTGTNVTGSTNVGVDITVNDAAPTGLAYSTNPAVYTAGTPITNNTPSNGGGVITGYSVAPALPAGLSLHPTTGVISGTPSAIVTAATYTVTGTNSGGSTNVGVLITVNNVPPTGLSYSTNPAAYPMGTAISNNVPSNGGGVITSYSVVPSLPAGLSLDPSTGIISGTPSAITGTATYTVTGSNSGGSTNVGVQITVNDAAPTGLAYSTNPATYTRNTAISANNPSNSGGVITSYSVAPALPAGLSLHPTTGVISGTPTAATATATYTVTGTNVSGSTNVGVQITVNDSAPTGLAYSTNPASYQVLIAISANNPSNSGGVITSYSVVPALPAGLSLHPTTGVISGTPTAITGTATYTVTGTNVSGSTNVGVQITINDGPPASLTYSTNPATYVRGTAIAANNPSNSGGIITGYSVVPALPAGLSLHPTTGVISGTPTAVTGTATYTVTGSNVSGSTNVGVQITVNDIAPATLTYSTNPAIYDRTVAIAANNPSSSGGAITGYSVAPALPAGLSLHPTTGVISGTPTVTAAAATYTVTGTNTGGSTNVGVQITVNAVPPANLNYLQTTVTYPVGVAITPNIPSSTGDPITNYSVVPALPSGLSLDPSTGIITGTPTATTATATYTVTGTNTGGSTNRALSITISSVPPVLASIFPVGGPITGGTPVSLTGSFFLPGATVTIGGVSCGSVNVVSGTMATCVTGASTIGLYDVTLTNPDTLSSTITGRYLYSGTSWLGGAAQMNNAWVTGGVPVPGLGDGMIQSTLSNHASADGHVYVVDDVGHRVAKYVATTGEFVGWIGRVAQIPTGGVAGCTTAISGNATPGWCKGGTPQAGAGDGHFDTPYDATTDGTYIYIADGANDRVARFVASTGAYAGSIGRKTAGTTGTCPAAAGFSGGWCTGGTFTTGTGNGMFNVARGVHVDSGTDTLFVSDRQNNRVQKFTASTGAFVGWIGRINANGGTCVAGAGNFTGGWCSGGTSQSGGTGNGSMSSPRNLNADATYLYVSDSSNFRINRYTKATGAFQGWIGRINATGGTCTAGAGLFTGGWCTGGTSQAGTIDGAFGTNMRGATADPAGNNLFVGDYANDRVERFNLTTGAFTGWIGRINASPTSGDPGCAGALSGTMTPGWCLGGSAQGGNGAGEFNGPASPTMDPSRVYIYVCDDLNVRLSRYYLNTGQFQGSLGGIQSVSPAWVSGGVPMAGTGDGMMTGSTQAVQDGTYLYVSDSSNHRIARHDLATGSFQGWIGRILTSPTGGAGGCSGAGAGNFTPGWCTGGTSQSGNGSGHLNTPRGMAIYSATLLVADAGNHRVAAYNKDTGAFLGWLGRIAANGGTCTAGAGNFTGGWCSGGTPQAGTGTNGSLSTPTGVAIDSSGTNFYVVENGNHRVSRFTFSTGAFTGWIGRINANGGTCTSGAGNFTGGFCTGGTSQAGTAGAAATHGMTGPFGIALDASNNLLVADSGNNRINLYTSAGAFTGWLGRILANGGTCSAGAGNFTGGFCSGGTTQLGTAGDGSLQSPRGVSFNSAGTAMYVADFTNNRVAKYNYPSGSFVGWQGAIGAVPTGGDPGCTTAGVSWATPGWCTGGAAQAGNGNAMYNGPWGMAGDGTYIYITDNANARVVRVGP